MKKKPHPSLIGVIHLRPLAGAPQAWGKSPDESLALAGQQALLEAKLLEKSGFDAVIIENLGDAPFYKTSVPAETIASLSVLAAAVRETVKIPVGVNVLRNDARSALAIASVTGCDFIRVNVLSGVVATDQGLIESDSAFLARERMRLGAQSVKIYADVLVKHAATLSGQDLEVCIEDTALRGSAEGVILTGSTTGRPVDFERLKVAGEICRHHRLPLWVGSGATIKNIATLKPHLHGVIVGSALRERGKAGAPMVAAQVKAFAKAFRAQKKSSRI